MDELQLTDIIKIIKKRNLVLISFVLVSMILTTFYLLKVPPVYQATAKVLIEPKPSKTNYVDEDVNNISKDQDSIKTQYALFKNRSLIKKVLVKLDLLESEEFDTPPLIDLVPLKDWLQNTMVAVGIIQEKTDENIEMDPYAPLIDSFLDRLEVAPVDKSEIVSIQFEGFSPHLIAKITNTLVDLYIVEQDHYQKILKENAEQWVKSQGNELSDLLEKSNAKVQEFIKNEKMVDWGGKRDFTSQQYSQTLKAANKIQTDIIQLRSVIQQIEGAKASPKQLFDAIPEYLKGEAINTLRTSYLKEVINFEYLSKNLKPSHPSLVKSLQKIRAIEASIPGEAERFLRTLKTDLAALQSQEQDLNSSLSNLKADLMELDRKTFLYEQMKEEIESDKAFLGNLMDKRKEISIFSSYYVPPIRILDRAEQPRKPIKPKVGLLLVLGLSVGIFGGLMLVSFVESIDNKIKNEDDVKRQLPYRLLGSLGWYGKNGALNASKEKTFQLEREFKDLRTKFLPILSEDSTKVFITTSTFPGEGKTTVVSNLAISLGKVGKRVLIIDADLENPKFHGIFKIPNTPGIINILSNSNGRKISPIQTNYSNVWLIPAGEPSNEDASSPDVLYSNILPLLLNDLRKAFDVILIKTPPVLCSSNTRIIEKSCDGILYVMSSGMNDKKSIHNMIDQLISTPIETYKRRFLNGEESQIPELPGESNPNEKKFRIILTKVKDKKEDLYGYGYGPYSYKKRAYGKTS